MHRVEDVLDADAQLLGLGPVEVGEELGSIDLVDAKDPGELGRLGGLRHYLLHRRIERHVAQVGAVLDLKLEPANRPKALDRRRRKDGDEGVLHTVELRLELASDSDAGKVRASPRLERSETEERDPRARAIDEAIDGQPGKCDRVADARFFQGDISHLADHLLGPFQIGAIWQLRKADEIGLVLHRHEAGRNLLERKPGPSDQGSVDAEGECLPARDAADALAVADRAALEHAIEAPEERAENPLY